MDTLILSGRRTVLIASETGRLRSRERTRTASFRSASPWPGRRFRAKAVEELRRTEWELLDGSRRTAVFRLRVLTHDDVVGLVAAVGSLGSVNDEILHVPASAQYRRRAAFLFLHVLYLLQVRHRHQSDLRAL